MDFKNVDFEECPELYYMSNLTNALNIVKICCFVIAFIIAGGALWCLINKRLKSEDLSVY